MPSGETSFAGSATFWPPAGDRHHAARRPRAPARTPRLPPCEQIHPPREQFQRLRIQWRRRCDQYTHVDIQCRCPCEDISRPRVDHTGAEVDVTPRCTQCRRLRDEHAGTNIQFHRVMIDHTGCESIQRPLCSERPDRRSGWRKVGGGGASIRPVIWNEYAKSLTCSVGSSTVRPATFLSYCIDIEEAT